uniref:Uncharacterized protein n=1 Tax=Strongyloides papillosus TaxID=174720 RepID=A0A0N5BTP5_STREA
MVLAELNRAPFDFAEGESELLIFIKGYKNILVLGSTESFNWLILIMAFRLFSGLLLRIIYVVFFFLLLDHSRSKR